MALLNLRFEPITADTLATAYALKRATVVDNTGDAAWLARILPNRDAYARYVAHCQALGPAAAVLVYDGDTLVGNVDVGAYRPDPTVGYMFNIYITPAARGRGLGALLDDYAHQTLGAWGFRHLRLRTFGANTATRRFYDARGYTFLENAELGMVVLGREIRAPAANT